LDGLEALVDLAGAFTNQILRDLGNNEGSGCTRQVIPHNTECTRRRTQHKASDSMLLDCQVYAARDMAKEMRLVPVLDVLMRRMDLVSMVRTVMNGRFAPVPLTLGCGGQRQLVDFDQRDAFPDTCEEARHIAIGHYDPGGFSCHGKIL
jgi:hypothetical protein